MCPGDCVGWDVVSRVQRIQTALLLLLLYITLFTLGILYFSPLILYRYILYSNIYILYTMIYKMLTQCRGYHKFLTLIIYMYIWTHNIHSPIVMYISSSPMSTISLHPFASSAFNVLLLATTHAYRICRIYRTQQRSWVSCVPIKIPHYLYIYDCHLCHPGAGDFS